jgi:hypothetical protein
MSVPWCPWGRHWRAHSWAPPQASRPIVTRGSCAMKGIRAWRVSCLRHTILPVVSVPTRWKIFLARSMPTVVTWCFSGLVSSRVHDGQYALTAVWLIKAGPHRGGSIALTPSHIPPHVGTRPRAASQASRAVSAMRALRPMCTTGRRPVHRSLANVSGLTPNHRCASSKGISCGGAGISRGRSCWRADGRVLVRRRLDAGGIPGGSPLTHRACDAIERRALQTRAAWAEPGTTAWTIYANIISIY